MILYLDSKGFKSDQGGDFHVKEQAKGARKLCCKEHNRKTSLKRLFNCKVSEKRT